VLAVRSSPETKGPAIIPRYNQPFDATTTQVDATGKTKGTMTTSYAPKDGRAQIYTIVIVGAVVIVITIVVIAMAELRGRWWSLPLAKRWLKTQSRSEYALYSV